MKLGRKRPAHRMRLHLRNYLKTSELPPVPPSVDYSPAAKLAIGQLYDNDRYGDCVIAGGYHVVGVLTANANGSPFIATEAQILGDYHSIGGFDPNNPQATDNGCDEQTAFQWWTKTGFADGTKLQGSVSVDATNQAECQAGLFLFENLFFGIELPDAWINPFPSASGFVWDVAGDPNPENGHCVVATGYNTTGIQIATWGLIGTITWAAVAKYCAPTSGGELYTLLSPDQISRALGKAPNGFTVDQLQADFAVFNNAVPVGPAVPTMAQVQQWAADGIAENWPSPVPSGVDSKFDG